MKLKDRYHFLWNGGGAEVTNIRKYLGNNLYPPYWTMEKCITPSGGTAPLDLIFEDFVYFLKK